MNNNEDTSSSTDVSPEEQSKPRTDWSDPSVPVGNSPTMPRWPLLLSAIAWIAWVVFLLAMTLTRASAVSPA